LHAYAASEGTVTDVMTAAELDIVDTTLPRLGWVLTRRRVVDYGLITTDGCSRLIAA